MAAKGTRYPKFDADGVAGPQLVFEKLGFLKKPLKIYIKYYLLYGPVG